MKQNDLKEFFKMYATVALARGESPDPDRMQLYFDKLKQFDLQPVISALEWAMSNLHRFPILPDLIAYIEGNPENRSNLAWKAIQELLPVGPNVTLILTDPVMSQTIMKLWGDWAGTYAYFLKSENVFELSNLRKMFKAMYLEQWEHRHEFGPVTFYAIEPNPKDLVIPITIHEYTIEEDYEIRLSGLKSIEPILNKGQPISKEMQGRIDNMLVRLMHTALPYADEKLFDRSNTPLHIVRETKNE